MLVSQLHPENPELKPEDLGVRITYFANEPVTETGHHVSSPRPSQPRWPPSYLNVVALMTHHEAALSRIGTFGPYVSPHMGVRLVVVCTLVVWRYWAEAECVRNG
jgi:hypothetical protein